MQDIVEVRVGIVFGKLRVELLLISAHPSQNLFVKIFVSFAETIASHTGLESTRLVTLAETLTASKIFVGVVVGKILGFEFFCRNAIVLFDAIEDGPHNILKLFADSTLFLNDDGCG